MKKTNKPTRPKAKAGKIKKTANKRSGKPVRKTKIKPTVKLKPKKVGKAAITSNLGGKRKTSKSADKKIKTLKKEKTGKDQKDIKSIGAKKLKQ